MSIFETIHEAAIAAQIPIILAEELCRPLDIVDKVDIEYIAYTDFDKYDIEAELARDIMAEYDCCASRWWDDSSEIAAGEEMLRDTLVKFKRETSEEVLRWLHAKQERAMECRANAVIACKENGVDRCEAELIIDWLAEDKSITEILAARTWSASAQTLLAACEAESVSA